MRVAYFMFSILYHPLLKSHERLKIEKKLQLRKFLLKRMKRRNKFCLLNLMLEPSFLTCET